MTGLRALAIVALVALALAGGCGEEGGDEGSPTTPPATTEEATTAPTTDETTTAAPEDDGAGSGGGVVVQIAPLPGSSERGTATLTPLGGGTHVELDLEGGRGGGQRADIRKGTCERPGRRPSVRLEDVEGGRSETHVSIPLERLQGSDYVIVVQRSTAEPNRHVACGYLAAI
jgi:hypothetical protein